MRVHVVTERCQGHNRCVTLAPDLFELDEYGTACAATDSVPVEREHAARLAAASCPEEAIEIAVDEGDRGDG
jgi:ferredoxin